MATLTLAQAGWILLGATADCPCCGGIGRVTRAKVQKRPNGRYRHQATIRRMWCPLCKQSRRLGEHLLATALENEYAAQVAS